MRRSRAELFGVAAIPMLTLVAVGYSVPDNRGANSHSYETGGRAMITCFRGMNISSKDPKRLATFYRDVLCIPVREESDDCDGVSFGNPEGGPVFWIWDENRWGKSNQGIVCLVFNCDNHLTTYEELRQKGVELETPVKASWGGMELTLKDPDGNTILVL
jgi:predicted enzyme related to lactoylglutathione lyase